MLFILATAVFFLLDWWAFHTAIAAVNTTVAFLRLQQFITIYTLIKVLTGISWHDFLFLMSTLRTNYC